MENLTLTSKGEVTAEGVLVKPLNEQFFKQYISVLKGNGNLKEEIKQLKQEEILLEERKEKTVTSLPLIALHEEEMKEIIENYGKFFSTIEEYKKQRQEEKALEHKY